MSDAPTDFYHQKTDAELLFFVDHPEQYQPSLVEAAWRELRRRGVLPAPVPTPPAPVSAPDSDPDAGDAPTRWGARVAALGLGALLVWGIIHWLQQRNEAQGMAVRARQEARMRQHPPRLTEVATSVIPDYGDVVAQCVEQQFQRVPAAEQAAATRADQPLHQYRELARRFWAAETQAEYVAEQAKQADAADVLPGHAEQALAAWQDWNKALAYSYKFGPVMANHLDLMSRVARQQQEGLGDLLTVTSAPHPFTPKDFDTEKTRQRAADVSDLLSGLVVNSPVTGRPYNTVVRHVQL